MEDALIECPACAFAWAGRKAAIADHELFVCSNCGLWFCNPDAHVGIDYDDVYRTVEYQEEYSDSLDEANWNKLAEFPTFKQFFTLYKPGQNTRRLLDVGCGVGRFCRAAHSLGWDVTGIDISKAAIEKGNTNVPFTLLNCTVEELLDANEGYDVVTAFEVLEHLLSPLDFLKAIRKIIKPKGTFYCTVPNIESLTVVNSSRKDWIPPIHVLFFTQKALYELLKRAGFEDVTTEVFWVNSRPNQGLKLVHYYLKRLACKDFKPDPLGLWASGRR